MLAALLTTVVLLALAWVIVRAGSGRRTAHAAPLAPLAPRLPRMTPVDGTILPAGVYPFDVSGWTQESSAGADAGRDADDTGGDPGGSASSERD